MKRPTLIAAVLIFVAGAGAYWWWGRRDVGPTDALVVEICARDLRAASRRPMAPDVALARCRCVQRELDKSEDGREVLGLILQYKKFLDIIESAASHAVAFEVMASCAR